MRGPIFLILIVLSIWSQHQSALAEVDGTGTISYQIGENPGVSAEAYSYTPPGDESVGQSVGPIVTTTGSGGNTPVGTPSHEVPEAEEFSVVEILDNPSPCFGRIFWAKHCSHSAANNDDNDRRDPGSSQPRGPSPEEIIASAIDRAVSLAPSPQLVVAPSHLGLTGLDSFFWLDSPLRPVTATAGVPGLTVVARAVPTQYIWNFGDGSDYTSADSGRPWTRDREGSISHLYETAGTYRLGVTVIWEAAYSINGGTWQSIGSFSTSGSRPYRVQQMVPALVSSV